MSAPSDMENTPWHTLADGDVAKRLRVSLDRLTSADVARGTEHFGPNSLPAAKRRCAF